MSLKTFHLLFIFASIVLAFGFAGWSLHSYFHDGPKLHLWFGALSIVVGLALVWYGKYVLKKLKKFSYL
jgi:hypothetical protein